jgi:hypothetical protein
MVLKHGYGFGNRDEGDGAAGVVRKEEDGGSGVRWTVYPSTIIYLFFGNLHQILAVHGEVGTVEQI